MDGWPDIVCVILTFWKKKFSFFQFKKNNRKMAEKSLVNAMHQWTLALPMGKSKVTDSDSFHFIKIKVSGWNFFLFLFLKIEKMASSPVLMQSCEYAIYFNLQAKMMRQNVTIYQLCMSSLIDSASTLSWIFFHTFKHCKENRRKSLRQCFNCIFLITM